MSNGSFDDLLARNAAYAEGHTLQVDTAKTRTGLAFICCIDSRVDPVTRSVAVRARLPNDDGLLKPGMFLTVNLIQQQGQVVAVPEEALVPEQASQYVFVAANGVAERRRIVIGRRQPGFVEVLNGLRPGERVIVEGTQKVRDGTAIKDAPMGPVPEPGGT